MAEIVGQRNKITVEEMQTGSAAAESTMNRVGASINLLLEETQNYVWNANGPYSNQGSPQFKIDGEKTIIDNLQCVGYFLNIETAGSSGTLEVDIIRTTVAGSSASIFSVTPKILFSSGSFSRLAYDFRTNTVIRTATGATQGVLSISNFNPGDVLQLNVNNHQVGGIGFCFGLAMRVR